MKRKLIVLLGGIIVMCYTLLKNVDSMSIFVGMIEALADGGDVGTADFYLDKSHTKDFHVSEWSLKQKGININDIPKDMVSSRPFDSYVAFYCCEEDERDVEGWSCRPYYVSSSNALYTMNRENLCDIFTKGIWNYGSQKRR